MIMSTRDARAVRKTKAMQPSPGFRRYCPVLRLLLFLVMLLAPDFSDGDAPATSPEALQPAFGKGGPSRSADREVRS
jgi:hypothetical protein